MHRNRANDGQSPDPQSMASEMIRRAIQDTPSMLVPFSIPWRPRLPSAGTMPDGALPTWGFGKSGKRTRRGTLSRRPLARWFPHPLRDIARYYPQEIAEDHRRRHAHCPHVHCGKERGDR
jgi:hypothetical protein